MANPYFQFKQFTVYHDRCAMKVTTDSCFFGAWAAEEIRNSEFKVHDLLDIGAGTGLLSLLIAQKNAVEIDAVEIDEEASGQAKENIAASPWKDRIRIFNENILSFHPDKKYDCIVCNPPFYENELASSQQRKNTAHHSRQLTVSQVINVVKTHLKEGGSFFLMYPYKRKEEVEKLIFKNELYPIKSLTLRQSVQHQPFRVIVMGTNKKTGSHISIEHSVWDASQQYTPGFVQLLKDYYLYL